MKKDLPHAAAFAPGHPGTCSNSEHDYLVEKPAVPPSRGHHAAKVAISGNCRHIANRTQGMVAWAG